MSSGHSYLTDPAMRTKGYLLVAEAARKIGVAPSTIYRWIEERKVDGFREGYRRYVRWVSILEHLGPVSLQVRGLDSGSVFEETLPEE